MTDRRALALLVAIHVAMVAIVMPRGDFPLNDDWAYAQSVVWLLDEGRIRLSDWVGMNLVPQILLGAAASAVFGHGFETLRHVTQAASLAAMGAAYAWFRAVRLEPRDSFVATAAVVSFPAWPVLANSFMTDIYGLALVLGSATCFARTLRDDTTPTWVAATLLALAAVLQRQVALAIAFAYMVAVLWTARPLSSRAIARATIPFAVTLAAEVAFHAYLVAGPGFPDGQKVHERLAATVLGMLMGDAKPLSWEIPNALGIAGYLGLFAVGWVAWWGMKGANTASRWIVGLGGGVLAVCSLAFGWLAPYRTDNVIDAAGIGPFMLYDAVRALAPLDRSPGLFWACISVPTAFAIAAAAAMMVTSVGRMVLAGRQADRLQVFVIAVIVAYLGPFIATDYFDRYLLYVLPFLFALWTMTWGPGGSSGWTRSAAVAWIACSMLLGAAATRDYFSWNRARWDALHDLERAGVGADAIDGGFEYNALRRFESVWQGRTAGKSWYWVRDDRFVIAFGPVAGYRTIRATPVSHWLPRSPAQVLLLERKVE